MEQVDNIIDLARERRRRGPRFNGGLMDILEVSRDLVCLCRKGQISAINGAGARMLGSDSTEQLVGRPLAEFLIPEYGRVLELFLAGMASEDKPVPTRIRALNGTTTSVEMQVFRARELAGDATVVVCRDISHEGRLAQDGYETDQRFRLLVEHAMNLVVHVINDQIRYVNQAGQTMLNSSVDALNGKPLTQILHPDYHGLMDPEVMESVLADRETIPLRLVRTDGSAFDAMVLITRLPSQHGRELMLEARDITAHNAAVRALRHANETLEMRVVDRTRELAEQRSLAEEARGIADASRRFSEALLEAIPNPVWFKDVRGTVQTCNAAFRALFAGQTPEAWQMETAMPVEDMDSDAILLSGQAKTASFEARLRTADMLVLKSAFQDDEGHVVGIIGVLTDISQRKQMEGELRRLATIDPLTGCFNRRHFLEVSDVELERSLRYDHPVSVIMLDIDHFKRINDTHGHPTGDEAIKAFAQTCLNSLRDVDYLGRLGGEEFAVLLPETDLYHARDVAERLRQQIAAIRLPLEDGQHLSFTTSLGVAALRKGEEGLDGLLARADASLYAAKSNGRNRVETA